MLLHSHVITNKLHTLSSSVLSKQKQNVQKIAFLYSGPIIFTKLFLSNDNYGKQ